METLVVILLRTLLTASFDSAIAMLILIALVFDAEHVALTKDHQTVCLVGHFGVLIETLELDEASGLRIHVEQE